MGLSGIQNIPIDFVKTSWTIFSYAAKWGDQKKVIYADSGGAAPTRSATTSPLMKAISKHLLDEADVVVARNDKKLVRIRKADARFIKHGDRPGPRSTR